MYIAGSPFINLPWGADSYSPLDMTLLDRHFGAIKDWRHAVDEMHRRGMYVVLDNTMSTYASHCAPPLRAARLLRESNEICLAWVT